MVDGLVLTGPARARFVLWGFSVGFDTDDRDPQLQHICWPQESGHGALCGRKHLWCIAREVDLDKWGITCVACVEAWGRLSDVENLRQSDLDKLLAVQGALVQRLMAVRNVLNG